MAMDHSQQSACQWCGAPFARGETSCSRCGAALSIPEEVSPSGWAQLPGRKDMAKIQFRKFLLPDRRPSCQWPI